MTTSSPALHTASRVEIMASVEPQQTVTSFSGSTVIPCQAPIWRAMALRRFFAPQVIAYWLTSAAMASWAACLMAWGAEKSGNPWARLTAPWTMAWRVISRITDSVKCETLSLRKCLPGSRADVGDTFRELVFRGVEDWVAIAGRLAHVCARAEAD